MDVSAFDTYPGIAFLGLGMLQVVESRATRCEFVTTRRVGAEG